MVKIRAEQPEDIAAIRSVNVAAFGRSNEADLVDRLVAALRVVARGDRLRGVASTVSFVAVESGEIVGHIFYSPVAIDGTCPEELFILGLAPIAILPQHQRQGIGSLLIQQSLRECDRLGCRAVVVLGHPAYYSRFGFVPARTKGLSSEYTVPDEVFMVLELASGALQQCSGIVKYRPEFSEVE